MKIPEMKSLYLFGLHVILLSAQSSLKHDVTGHKDIN